MLGPFQVAASSRTRVVESETSESRPPITPAMPPEGPVLVADQDHLRVEDPLVAVESRDLLAVAGAADDQEAARDLVEVVGVKRLPGQQHHVVRDVDDVRDRPLARGDQAGAEPQRRGAHLDALEGARGESRAELRHLDLDPREVVGGAGAGGLRVLGPGRRRQLGARDRVDLAGDAVEAQAVRAVRVEVELQDLLGDREDLATKRCAREHGAPIARRQGP